MRSMFKCANKKFNILLIRFTTGVTKHKDIKLNHTIK